MTKHNAPPQTAPLSAPWEVLIAANNPMAAAFSQAGEACFRACVDWQQEVARFVGARLAADKRAQESLAVCSTFTDVLKVQQEWASAAVKEYTEEATRLAEIASRSFQGGTVTTAQAPQSGHAHAAE
jgi:hypothetical protein